MIGKRYKECWQFIKESRNYIYIIFVLLVLSALIGFFFPVFFNDFIKKFIQESINAIKGLGFFQLFIYILKNNMITALLSVIFGIVFGIFPLLTTLFNGYVIGYVASASVKVAGYSVLFRLLPHGIFEIPAIVIALALGLRLGTFIFRKKARLKYEIDRSAKVFLYVVIPLLVIAALIEAFFIILVK